MKFFSIGKKLSEKPTETDAENVLVTMTNEEWENDEFRHLPHHKKVTELSSRIPGVHIRLFPNCIFGTLLLLQKGNRNGKPCPLSFYFNENRFYIIGNQSVTEKLIHRLSKTSLPDSTTAESILGVIINSLIDEDNIFFTGLESSLEKTEESALKNADDTLPIKLNSFRKELRRYKSLYGQLSNLSLDIQSNPYNMLSPEQCAEYAHIGSRALLMSEHIKDLTEYLLQIKDVYQSQVDMKQTRAMNILTVVSSVFLPLTLITGWYGMNFVHMPELKWDFSYLAVLIVSIIIVITEILIFRKKGLFK